MTSSETLKTISIFLISLTLLVQVAKKEVKIEFSLLKIGFILFLLTGVITSIFADNPIKSFKGAKDIIFYTIPLFATSTINDEKQQRTILWALYLSTAIATLFGIIHSLQIQGPLEIPALRNENYNAMYFIMVLSSLVSTVIFSDKEGKMSKTILGVFSVLMLIAAILTEARTPFVAFFAFLAILFFNYRHIRSVKLITPVLLLLMMALIYFYTPLRAKLFTTHSLEVRLLIWQHALALLREHFTIGLGLNHFRFNVPDYLEKGSSYFDAHSIYFQTASQMGIFGLISLFLIIFGFVYTYLKLPSRPGLTNSIKYSALGGFLVVFAGGIFDTTLHHEHAIAFTVLTGLMLGLAYKNQSFTTEHAERAENEQV